MATHFLRSIGSSLTPSRIQWGQNSWRRPPVPCRELQVRPRQALTTTQSPDGAFEFVRSGRLEALGGLGSSATQEVTRWQSMGAMKVKRPRLPQHQAVVMASYRIRYPKRLK